MKQFGTETRPGQLAFYNAAVSKLNSGGVLLAEAPPGVGKTLAYLNAAVTHGRYPIIIAVHRRALQDQIIADCARHFPDLKAVVIKGHNAYGCGKDLPDWAKGELPKDLSHEQREKVSSNRCLKVGDCYAKKAKIEAWKADIVVCTHVMLCLDQKLRKTTQGAVCILPDSRYLIIDEAHCLYWEAVGMMSHKVSPRSFSAEEEFCVDWLKAFKKRVFQGPPDGVDEVIDIVQTREGYRLYEAALDSQEGEADLAGAELINQHGEAAFRRIIKEHNRTESLIESLNMIGHEDYVSWSEESGVIEVKPKESHGLTSALFKDKLSVVACSATLPFSMFKAEHKIQEAEEITVPSSFDKSKVRVRITGPHPTKMKFSHRKLVADSLKYLVSKEGGNILVLCASYDMASHCRDALSSASVPVVTQEPGEPLPDFPDGGVMIACESAWAGFDRRGLKAVVITSVPYLVPDPWVNSMLDSKGWGWYNTQAKTKLIQGIGRLQRSQDDHGIVLILDDRAKRLVKEQP